ncbi:MAG: MATE family efflux transporter [Clostridia bacterium]|nr:MATE family efflux transporter [Clostridia bacterium]
MRKKYIDKNFIKTALSLAIPIAVQNLLTNCATLIDTFMVMPLGNYSTSALGVATRFSFLLNVICFGFASGCATLIAQYYGAKQGDNIKKTFGLTLAFSLTFSIVYALCLAIIPSSLMHIFVDDPITIELGAKYLRTFSIGVPFLVFSQISCIALRSVERVKIPFISSAIAVAVNLFFNYCLITGNLGFPALELTGAALGSVLGFICQAVFLIFVLIFSKTPFKAKVKELFSFDKAFVKKYLKISMPVLLNEILWAVGTNVYVTVIARQGAENHAGYTLYENIQQLLFVFFVGVCSACSVMVGKSVGAGEHEKAYSQAKWFAVATPVLGAILGALLILVRNPLLSVFPFETEGARKVASDCLLFYSFWISMRNIPYTLVCGVFRAGGDTKSGVIIDLINMYLIGIPAVLITGLLIKPAFIVIIIVMFAGEDVIKSIMCIKYFLSKKWIKQLTNKVPKEIETDKFIN